MTTRIAEKFATCARQNRPALGIFVMAGDPDLATAAAILKALPGAGADMIEFGMPFSDPMADGPGVQAAGQRALASGQTLNKTLAMVADFRTTDTTTPIILMGYYNPIYIHGVEAFIRDALAAGVDGLIVVDLPPEEDSELCIPALAAGLNFIRLATPTTDDHRLPVVLKNTSGFVYYVSMTGITGTALGDLAGPRAKVAAIRERGGGKVPVAVGFGIRTPEAARAVASFADAVVVGSAAVEIVERAAAAKRDPVPEMSAFVRSLRQAVVGSG